MVIYRKISKFAAQAMWTSHTAAKPTPCLHTIFNTNMLHPLRIIPLLVLWLWAIPSAVGAQHTDDAGEGERDSIVVSVLTCSPGADVYELYGHTALRVRGVHSGRDFVFNYGVFDFNAPHFAWRFMMGQTDYTIGVVDYATFVSGYQKEQRRIAEQTLRLTQQEATKLIGMVENDLFTPEWTYRYNFLYDNCTTRVMDLIGRAVDGEIVWPQAENGQRTFRDMIHEYAAASCPWSNLGQDIVLGAEMDVPLDVRHQLFSPVYASRFLDSAVVHRTDGSISPLVERPGAMDPRLRANAATTLPSPLAVATGLLLLTLGIVVVERRRHAVFTCYDDLLLLLQGSIGCIVGLLFFCSEHPAVGSNWLILLFHPLALAALPVKIVREKRGCRPIYPAAVALEVIIAGIALACSPQRIPAEVYILLGILALRAYSTAFSPRKSLA